MAALILFCTLWRLPGLADPPWLNDEGTYATVGRAIMQGEDLYRQIWENKPPAIYLLYGTVHLITGTAHLLLGVRVLALLAAIITQIAVYRLVLGVRDHATALLAVAFCGLGVDLPLLDGAAANAEIFLAAATSTGMALLWRASTPPRGERLEGTWARSVRGETTSRAHTAAPVKESLKGWSYHAKTYVAAGIAFGIAILFKLPAGADLLAALAILLTGVVGRAAVSTYGAGRLGAAAALLLGAALPVGLVTAWLASRGLLGDALYATIGYNRGYVATGQGQHSLVLTLAGLMGLLALALLGVWLAWRARGDIMPSLGAAACWWLALASLGALSSGRSYPHYYLQAIPPLAVCLALLAYEIAALATADRGVPNEAPLKADPYRHLAVTTGATGTTEARRRGGDTEIQEGQRGRAGEAGKDEPIKGEDSSIGSGAASDSTCSPRSEALRRALAVLLVLWAFGVPLISWLALQRERPGDPPGSNPLAYYGHAWQRLTGTLDETAFGNRLDPHVERNLAVIRYLNDHPATPRRLYIWGNSPWIYYLSGYAHAARFISAYYNPPIPGGMDQVLASLRADPPPYVVVIEPPKPQSPALTALIQSRYRLVQRIDNAAIYRIKPVQAR